MGFARSVTAGRRSASSSRDGNLVPFGSIGAAIKVIDASLLIRSSTFSTVVSGAMGGAIRLALYTETSVMPTALAPVTGAALTVGATMCRDSMAEIGQQRITVIAANANPVTTNQRTSPASPIGIPGRLSWSWSE